MPRRRAPHLALTLLAACAGPGAQAPRGAGPPPATLSLQVLVQTGAAAPRPLRPGEALAQGDGVALRLEVDRRAYVYLSHAAPDGARRALFPTSFGAALLPGQALRVPEGDWLQLDAGTGEEVFYAVVATYPLGRADRELCETLGLACLEPRSSEKKEPPPPPPPPNVTVATRGLPRPAAGATLRAQTDPWGVAVLRLALPHRPR